MSSKFFEDCIKTILVIITPQGKKRCAGEKSWARDAAFTILSDENNINENEDVHIILIDISQWK